MVFKYYRGVARILVIDDDAGMRRLVRRFLERGGSHEVLEAGDGREGVEVFRAQAVDLVLCDLVMPEMDGLTAIAAMQALSPTTPIIAISGGMRSRELLPEAQKLDVVRTIAKPVFQDQLLAAVGHALYEAGRSSER